MVINCTTPQQAAENYLLRSATQTIQEFAELIRDTMLALGYSQSEISTIASAAEIRAKHAGLL